MSTPEIILLIVFGWLGLSALAGLVWIALAEMSNRRRQRLANAAERRAIAAYIARKRRAAANLRRWAKEYGK